MAAHRRFELDELTLRPGTYFNPQTEVLLVIDDSPELDHELFDGDEGDETTWVLISNETPLDEHRRDELIENFQASAHTGANLAVDRDHDEDEEENEQLEPDELEDE
jgi:hypothetical protein